MRTASAFDVISGHACRVQTCDFAPAGPQGRLWHGPAYRVVCECQGFTSEWFAIPSNADVETARHYMELARYAARPTKENEK